MGMNISDFFDMDVLIQILTDWSTATGIGIIAVDEKGEYMMDPIGWKDFCMKYTRGTKEGLRRCVKCDQEGQGVYFCHAGLIDFTADIKIGDHFIGKLVGGQVLPQPPDEEHFRNLAVELGIDPDEYIEALQDITVRTEEEIRASAKLLDEVVNIVVNSQYVRKKEEDLILIFDQEIDKASDLIREINGKSCELDKIEGRQRILGLNASIEAARAGEAGRGFAVVASEIGDLAQQTSDALNQSSAIIERSAETIQQGLDMAMQTAQSFKEIQDVTDQYEVISAQLAEIVKAQTDAVTEVNEQLDSLKDIASQNQNLAEETDKMATNFLVQSEELKDFVSQVKLRDHGNA